MGKTLKREKRRAEAAAAAGRPLKKGGATPGGGSSGTRLPPNLPHLISEALTKRDWAAALRYLGEMRVTKKVPKLGSVQRWVRDADGSGSEKTAARLISAVLLAADPNGVAPPPFGPPRGPCRCGDAAAAGKDVPVRRFPAWRPPVPPPQQLQAGGAAGDEGEVKAANTATAAASTAAVALGRDKAAAAVPDAAALAPEAAPQPPAATSSPHQQQAPAFYEIQRAPGAGGSDSFVTGTPVRIYGYPPNTAVHWDPTHPPVARADVPCVPGAFVLVNALSPAECCQVLAAGRALGFNRGVDYSFSGGGNDAASAATAAASAARVVAARAAGLPPVEGRPAEGSVWLVDGSVLGPLYARVAHLLPQTLGGGALAGVNPRWRMYRYRPGAVFRPHVDGAWPGSGLDAEGRYLFDAHGDRWSRLTFLIYLNGGGEEGGQAGGSGGQAAGSGSGSCSGGEAAGSRSDEGKSQQGQEGGAAASDEDGVKEELDINGLPVFEGGATTFFSPRPGVPGCLDAHGVAPRAGNILVFVHGDTAGALVHEGSAVTRGSKYVVRTEVLYKRPQQQHQQQPRGRGGGSGNSGGGGAA